MVACKECLQKQGFFNFKKNLRRDKGHVLSCRKRKAFLSVSSEDCIKNKLKLISLDSFCPDFFPEPNLFYPMFFWIYRTWSPKCISGSTRWNLTPCALLPSKLASFADFPIFVTTQPFTMTPVTETWNHSRLLPFLSLWARCMSSVTEFVHCLSYSLFHLCSCPDLP